MLTLQSLLLAMSVNAIRMKSAAGAKGSKQMTL